jgi:hypothetical protein
MGWIDHCIGFRLTELTEVQTRTQALRRFKIAHAALKPKLRRIQSFGLVTDYQKLEHYVVTRNFGGKQRSIFATP